MLTAAASLHHMRMLQGGAEGGRVRLSQGLSGGDPVPVQEKKVCALISGPDAMSLVCSLFSGLFACVAGWYRAMDK